MGVDQTTKTKTGSAKMTIRIPETLQARLKALAQKRGQSVNSTLVEALAVGLEAVEARVEPTLAAPAPAVEPVAGELEGQPESEYERTLRVIRESGLWAPLGPEWDKYIEAAGDLTVEEIRELWRGQPPLSEDIIAERRERE